MKLHKYLLYSIFISIAGLLAVIFTAPAWVNHSVPKPFIIKYAHKYLRSNLKDPGISFVDYKTDLMSYIQFDGVEISPAKLAKHLIDRIVVRYAFEDLPRRKFSGVINYGSIRVVFDAEVLTPQDIRVWISTNWMDAEELSLKILRKLWAKTLKDVSMNGTVRVTAECRYVNGKPYIKGVVHVNGGDLLFSEYNLKFDRLNGYMPFHYDPDGKATAGTEPGKVTVETVTYNKLKFSNVRGDVVCSNLTLTFPKLIAGFMRSQAEGSGRLWFENEKIGFRLEGIFQKIDFDGFNELINNPEYRINGHGNGRLIIEGVGSKLKECFIRLASIEQNGTVNVGAIRKLLGYLPQNDLREKVEIVIKDKPVFVFTKGFFSFEKKKGVYEANLLLDGDHLLDFKINIDEEIISDIIE